MSRGAGCIGTFVGDRDDSEGESLSVAMIEPICECRGFGTHVEYGAKSAVREPGGHGVLMELLSDVVPGAVNVHCYL